MFQAIQNFIQWFVDLAGTLFDFVKNIIDGLGNMIKAFPQVISMTTNAIGYLPSTIAVFATLTITISIVYIVLGRNSGG